MNRRPVIEPTDLAGRPVEWLEDSLTVYRTRIGILDEQIANLTEQRTRGHIAVWEIEEELARRATAR